MVGAEMTWALAVFAILCCFFGAALFAYVVVELCREKVREYWG